MKKNLLALAVAVSCQAAMAGTVAGFGGGTEITQLMNNTQLILQYQQAVDSYLRQGLQLQNELKNLIQNPASLMGVEVGGLINNVGKIMSGGLAIGGNLAQIDKNFAATFKSPTAETLSKNFFKWHKTSTDTLEGAPFTQTVRRRRPIGDSELHRETLRVKRTWTALLNS